MDNLKWQLTNLEDSKKLKALGFKKKSPFGWYEIYEVDIKKKKMVDTGKKEIIFRDDDVAAYKEIARAYTASELGKELPYQIGKSRYDCHTLRMQNEQGIYLLSYEKEVYDKKKGKGTEYLHSECEDSEVNSRAKMLIYLLKNNLI